jgi:cytochrome c oxidase subunit 2
MIVITLIITLVAYAIAILIHNKLTSRNTVEAQRIETIWTILPALILIVLAFPSLRLLYLIDETSLPTITIKSIGHQWYWRYEYSDFNDIEFDAYIVPEADLAPGDYRLLEVDNRTVLPINTEIRLLVTAADVIHSWTIPSLGVKADAIPGRLNQMNIISSRPGVFYGQCSEICGANHSFMPIAVEFLPPNIFLDWLNNLPSEE